MATIKEVAQKAGVSVGTVSNVIGNTIRVGPKLRQRVLTAIHELGYYPSHVARSLKLRRTNTLGLLVSDITNPFFSQLVRGAEDAALEQGYLLLTFNTDDQVEREKQVLEVLRERRVDGILLVVAPGREGSRHIAETMARGTPLVCLDRLPPGIAVDAVTVDNVRASRKCVEHLLALGHRRIAILTGSMLLTTARERLQGYKQALRRGAVPADPGLIREGNFRIDDGYELTCQLLRGSDRPTALFVSNGLMAIGALKAIATLGLRCPEEIALATFDDSPLNELLSPPLTSVAQPAHQIGYRGAGILLDRIMSKGPARPCRIRLHAELKIRESTTGYALPSVSRPMPTRNHSLVLQD
jgi:DNA-binding LacI/PurR family transcriptional regulator